MPDGPPVTVVVPTRDRPALLARAVRSVLRQSYSRFELRVVDDGSDPPARLPAEAEADPRVRLIRLDRPAGAGPARNAGARGAGPVLAFLDDDDEWFPWKLERQVPGLVGSGAEVAGVDCGYELWERGRLRYRFVPDPRRDLQRDLLVHPSLYTSAVIMTRDAFDSLGGFDPALRRVEDWDLWLRLADRYRVLPIPRVLLRRFAAEVSPDRILRWHGAMIERLRTRVEGLPPAERAGVRARHAFDLGVLHARLGQARSSRRWLLTSLAIRPSIQPALHLGRTVVGEAAWSAAARWTHAARRAALRAMTGTVPTRRK